jgi:hypothetical protein
MPHPESRAGALDVITPESCLPRSWSTSWLLGRLGRDGQPQTPASAAELMTTPVTRYGRALAAGTLAPRLPTRRVNERQLLSVLVDMEDIETSDTPWHPAVRRHFRGLGRKAVAALVLSGVALVIFGRLTLWTLLVIVAAAAIAAAARRHRPKK